MKIRLVAFGEIDIEGQHYDYDVVVEKGQVRKRRKNCRRPTAVGSATRHYR